MEVIKKYVYILLLLAFSYQSFAKNKGGFPEEIFLYLFVDGKQIDIPEKILDSLKQYPQEELDEEIIQSLIVNYNYQFVSVREVVLLPKQKKAYFISASSGKKIHDFVFNGLGPLDKFDFKNVLNSRINTPYRELNIKEDATRLQRSIMQRGYFNAKITEIKVQDIGVDFVRVIFEVDRGNPCKIQDVKIENSQINLLNFFTVPVETGAICDISAIKDALEGMQSKYVEQGYLSAKVELKDLAYSKDHERARVFINLTTGPKTYIRVEDLDTNITTMNFISSQNHFGYADILSLSDEDIRNMILKFYKKQGYPFATLSEVERTENKSKDIILSFKLKKGNFVSIKNVIFKGKLPTNKEDILNALELNNLVLNGVQPYNEEKLEQYKDTLESFYLDFGYLDVQVFDPEIYFSRSGTSVDIVFAASSGPQYIINNVTANFITPLKETNFSLEDILKTNQPYSEKLKSTAVDMLKNKLLQQGYYYADVKASYTVTETVGDDINKVTVCFTVDPGPVVRIREVFTEGDLFHKERAIVRLSGLFKGELFTAENLEQARLRLLKNSLFSNVKIEPLDISAVALKQPDLDVVIRTKGASGYSLTLSPGYGSYNGYHFQTDYALYAITEDGLRFNASAEISQERQQQSIPGSTNYDLLLERQLSLGVTEPLLKIGPLQTPVDLTGMVNWRIVPELLTNRQYITLRLTGEWRPYFFGQDWLLSLDLVNEESSTISGTNAVIQTIDTRSLRIREAVPRITLDTRDSLSWPRLGGLYTGQFNLARYELASEVRYDRYQLDINQYFPIFGSLSGAFSFGGIFVKDLSYKNATTQAPPPSRRASLLENTLVRGFPETNSAMLGPLLWLKYDPTTIPSTGCGSVLTGVGSANLLYMKTEARYRFSEAFGGVLFFDSGMSYYTTAEQQKINNGIQEALALSSGVSQCRVENASLISNTPMPFKDPNFFQNYWEKSYLSTGVGLRVIIGNFASINLDYGYPLRDPARYAAGCVSIAEATNSAAPPPCIYRDETTRYLNDKIQFKGAFTLGVGAKF